MIKIGICDDEQDEVRETERRIKDYFQEEKLECEIIATNNANEFLKHATEYDIAYLDIELNCNTDGVIVGKELRKQNKRVKLIYITSHEQYMITAMKAYFLQYLQKPINEQEFKTVLRDAISFLIADKNVIKVKTLRTENYFNLDNIIYAKTENRCTYMITKAEKMRISETLDDLKAKSNNFAFIHRSYLVNMMHVSAKTATYVIMSNTERLLIAQSRSDEFAEKIMKWGLL